jgi:hypothetical protein
MKQMHSQGQTVKTKPFLMLSTLSVIMYMGQKEKKEKSKNMLFPSRKQKKMKGISCFFQEKKKQIKGQPLNRKWLL